MWGFVTALNDILIPYLKNMFEFSNTQAQIVNFAFFGAYFVFALPSSSLIGKFGHQKSIVLALMVIGSGALLFYPAAEYHSFNFFLVALFIIASGITILQVSANPFVAALGPSDRASSRLNLAQGFNSLGTIIAPLMGAQLLLNSDDLSTQNSGEAVQLPYIVLGISLIAIAIVFAFAKLPKLEISQEKSTKKLKDFPHLIFGIIAIFFYVGAEVAVGSNIVFFLEMEEIAGFTEREAGFYVSIYWASAMVGRFIGAFLQTKYRPASILGIAGLIACALVLVGMFGKGDLAMYSVLAIGFFNSVMFPTIFSLSIKGLGDYTNTGSGLLIMAIVGGALIPPLMGYLSTDPISGDPSHLQFAFIVPLVCYIYIAFYAFKAYKIKLKN
tara:strand:- start:1149 stop:2303 length:1155 start_codon:yes stop_codon:yes gene_type:complete